MNHTMIVELTGCEQPSQPVKVTNQMVAENRHCIELYGV